MERAPTTASITAANPVEHRLNAADGTSLFAMDWHLPDAKGGIILMHGLGEHCGRYAHVARFFNECGWSVRAYDHRGHGRSGGPRGDIPDSDAMLRDAAVVISDFGHRFDGPPLLLGHSMGGLFAARFAAAGLAPLRGLILSSPALAVPLSGVQGLLLKALRTVAPGLGIPNGLQTRYLSHDPAVVAAYEKDALVHPKISARLLTGMLEAGSVARQQAAALRIPTLLLVAGDDHLVDASGSEVFYSRLSPGVGTLHRYADYYHEIFNEVGAAQVFADLRNWLTQQETAALKPEHA